MYTLIFDLIFRKPDKVDKPELGPQSAGVSAHRDWQPGESWSAFSQVRFALHSYISAEFFIGV